MPSSESNMNKKSIHVIKRGKRWAIRKYGASRALKLYDEKVDAILAASKIWEQGYDLVVHRKDGSVEYWKWSPTKQREVA